MPECQNARMADNPYQSPQSPNEPKRRDWRIAGLPRSIWYIITLAASIAWGFGSASAYEALQYPARFGDWYLTANLLLAIMSFIVLARCVIWYRERR
jgi:hypothetical protein